MSGVAVRYGQRSGRDRTRALNVVLLISTELLAIRGIGVLGDFFLVVVVVGIAVGENLNSKPVARKRA